MIPFVLGILVMPLAVLLPAVALAFVGDVLSGSALAIWSSMALAAFLPFACVVILWQRAWTATRGHPRRAMILSILAISAGLTITGVILFTSANVNCGCDYDEASVSPMAHTSVIPGIPPSYSTGYLSTCLWTEATRL